MKIDGMRWEIKKRALASKTKELSEKAWEVITDHTELFLGLLPAVAFMARRAAKRSDERRETYHREKEVYDHSLGMYHELRRKMKPHEKLEFASRRKAGEPVVSILSNMRLL